MLCNKEYNLPNRMHPMHIHSAGYVLSGYQCLWSMGVVTYPAYTVQGMCSLGTSVYGPWVWSPIQLTQCRVCALWVPVSMVHGCGHLSSLHSAGYVLSGYQCLWSMGVVTYPAYTVQGMCSLGTSVYGRWMWSPTTVQGMCSLGSLGKTASLALAQCHDMPA